MRRSTRRISRVFGKASIPALLVVLAMPALGQSEALKSGLTGRVVIAQELLTAETWPDPVPDLYLGEPVTVVAKLAAAAGEVAVSGWRGTVPWDSRFDAGAGAGDS